MRRHPEQIDLEFTKKIICKEKGFSGELQIETTADENIIFIKSTRFKKNPIRLKFIKYKIEEINKFTVMEAGNELVYRDKWVNDETIRMLRLAKKFLLEGKTE